MRFDTGARRVLSGVGAHLYAQFVTAAIQLVSLPIFLYFWSLDRYGIWLMLSAIPAYLAVSDIGMAAAAGNQMTMLRAKDLKVDANAVFQSAFCAIAVFIVGAAVTSAALIFLIDYGPLALLANKFALFALVCATLLNVFCGLFDAIYRSEGEYPRVTYILTTTRLAEWSGSVLGLMLTQKIEFVALGFCAGRLISVVLILPYTMRRFNTYKWSFQAARLKNVRALIKPALGMMSFPVGLAMSLQGVTLLVGYILGPASVAIFSTYRTICRLLTQVPTVFGKSLSPEISRLYGAENYPNISIVYRAMLRTSGVVTLLGSLLLLAGSAFALEAWTHGKIAYDFRLILIGLASCALPNFWQLGMAVITATNRHARLAMNYLFATIASLVVAYPLISMFGVVGAFGAAVFSDVVMIYCTRLQLSKLWQYLSKLNAKERKS